MLDLRNVTLLAITTRDYYELRKAIAYCERFCHFGNVVVFTDDPTQFPGRRSVLIRKMQNSQDVSIHNLTTMVQYRRLYTDFTLNIHSDSWVIHPECWTDEFYQYDYIGARWPDNVVGNDGFGWKSRKFWDELALLPFEPTLACCHPADAVMCMNHYSVYPELKCYRAHLESRGLRWSPSELANRFSMELPESIDNSFGFHGSMVMNQVLALEASRQR